MQRVFIFPSTCSVNETVVLSIILDRRPIVNSYKNHTGDPIDVLFLILSSKDVDFRIFKTRQKIFRQISKI